MRLTTPHAILLGAALIAIAVYLGLRSRDLSSARVEATASVGPVPVAPDLPPPPVIAVAPPVPPSAAALADAERSLAGQREALARACWTSQKGAPSSVAYSVHAQFDARGKLATKAMLSPRGPSRQDVIACVAEKLRPLEISPANAPATVDVGLTLP